MLLISGVAETSKVTVSFLKGFMVPGSTEIEVTLVSAWAAADIKKDTTTTNKSLYIFISAPPYHPEINRSLPMTPSGSTA